MSRMADISIAMQEWLVAALTGSQELADALQVELTDLPARIWDSTPPPEIPLPYISIVVTEPADVNTVPTIEVMARAECTVKLVDEAESYEEIQAPAKAVHVALQGKTNVPLNGGGTMLSCRRLRVVAYPEQTEGIEYRHLGGTYEVYAQ